MFQKFKVFTSVWKKSDEKQQQRIDLLFWKLKLLKIKHYNKRRKKSFD